MKAWLQKLIAVVIGGAVAAVAQGGLAIFTQSGFSTKTLYSCAAAAVVGGGTALFYFIQKPPRDLDADGDGVPDFLQPGKGLRATDPKVGDPPATIKPLMAKPAVTKPPARR